MSEYSLNDNVGILPGIGNKKRERLKAIGIETIEELLSHYPYRYRDKRRTYLSDRAPLDRDVLLCGRLIRKAVRRISSGRSIVECVMRDEGGNYVCAFFGSEYLLKGLNIGCTYTVWGKLRMRNGLLSLINPEICESGSSKDKRGILPIYRCTAGITNNDFNKWISDALDKAESSEWLSAEILERAKLCDMDFALRNIHFPENESSYKVARFRIIYDELLCYQLAVRLNSDRTGQCGAEIEDADIRPFIDSLPFSLTEGQRKAIEDIEADLINTIPMNRLIQGDVGAGKTVVAEAAIYKTVIAGNQAAFMAPTEILAKQHYENLAKDFSAHGIRTEILTGSTGPKKRRQITHELASGDIDVIIGTHALIQDDLTFNKLALVITDEQHRFGVNQRKMLVEKGQSVNAIVMSATPIPRTLAATVYGDMDFSIIKGKPSNRKIVITTALKPQSRGLAYTAVREELKKGHKAYVVAPSIDAYDDDISSVEILYKELKEKFSDYRIALLHGRLSNEEKDRIMSDFKKGVIQLIVATVVIEVGIDVPDASIIVIENSDRFGLAQMHQLRGRVGRSDIQSYCYLINYSNSDSAVDRARAMTELSDGFEISEEDFRQRGPGDISGTMQHGAYGNRIINLCKYENILNMAVRDADSIIAEGISDKQLEKVRSKLNEDNSRII